MKNCKSKNNRVANAMKYHSKCLLRFLQIHAGIVQWRQIKNFESSIESNYSCLVG